MQAPWRCTGAQGGPEDPLHRQTSAVSLLSDVDSRVTPCASQAGEGKAKKVPKGGKGDKGETTEAGKKAKRAGGDDERTHKRNKRDKAAEDLHNQVGVTSFPKPTHAATSSPPTSAASPHVASSPSPTREASFTSPTHAYPAFGHPRWADGLALLLPLHRDSSMMQPRTRAPPQPPHPRPSLLSICSSSSDMVILCHSPTVISVSYYQTLVSRC